MEVEEIQLKDLRQDKRNANKGKKAGNDKLSASVEKLGLGRGIVVDKDNFIIAGNHVQAEALKQGYTKAVIVETTGDTLVITKRTDVEIDSQIGRSLAIADNVTALESIDFDFDVLDELNAEFDLDVDFMPNMDLSMYSDENEYRGEGDNTKGTPTNNENENPYSTKIEAPIYEAKNEKPQIQALYKNERFNQLIEEVESSTLSKEEKEFLKLAAVRHIVFNYELIADFYAHSSKECQELMENSALVIIDFNKAIELGYVRLSEQIANQYAQDYANTEGVEDDE
jgi:hypothetical protein